MEIIVRGQRSNMTTIITSKESVFIIDKDSNINFDSHQEDGAAWNPTISDRVVDGGFNTTLLPGDTNNYVWNYIQWAWEYYNGESDPSCDILVQLVGIKQDLNESSPLYEYKITPSYPFSVNEARSIDLRDSISNPNLTVQNTNMSTGKIRVYLPVRWSNYINATLNRAWLNGWTKRKAIPLTAGAVGDIINGVEIITVTYDNDMKTDFSDIRFTDTDGITELDYDLLSKTNSSTASFAVQNIEISESNTEYIYIYYGNSTVSSNSEPFDTWSYYDDFEDGLLTNRTEPYQNLENGYGTPSIESSSPITSTYSVKHIGNGIDTLLNSLRYVTPNRPLKILFDFKLTTQGTQTSTPQIWLWFLGFDGTNFIFVYTAYDSGTNKQKIFLAKREGSTFTNIASADWMTGKLPTNTVYSFKIYDYLNWCVVRINDVLYISTAYTSVCNSTRIGFGADWDSAGVWDNIRLHVPDNGVYDIPTVGTMGAEESTISISNDGVGDEDQQYIDFTVPSDWTLSQPAYLELTELDRNIIRSHECDMKSGYTINMSPHSPTGFYALRLKYYVTGDDELAVNIYQVNGSYEYLEDLK